MLIFGWQAWDEVGVDELFGLIEARDLLVQVLTDPVGCLRSREIILRLQDGDVVAQVAQTELFGRGVEVVAPGHDVVGGFASGPYVWVHQQRLR